MNLPASEELDLLFARYQTADLGPAEQQRLLDLLREPASRRRWRLLSDLDGALSELGRAVAAEPAHASPVATRRLPRQRRSRPWSSPVRLAVLAAAAGILLVLGWLAWPSAGATPTAGIAIARLDPASSAIAVLRQGARVADARDLIAGDAVEVGTGQHATLRFADATTVEAGAGTRLMVLAGQGADGSGPGKLLELARGGISATVTHQPVAAPMAVLTPHARVVVVGTRLRVEVATATEVSVQAGEVRVEELASGRSHRVTAGGSVRVGGDPPPAAAAPAPAVLMREDFEDDGFRARGWYDDGRCILSAAEHAPGSAHAAEFRFARGAMAPLSGSEPMRRLFTPATAVRLSYAVKYASEWDIAGADFRVIQFRLMTTADGAWDAVSYTHLSCYLGLNRGIPFISLQDARNLDVDRIGQDLVALTEDRAVAGGNGDGDGHGPGAFFQRGDGRFGNGKLHPVTAAALTDQPGPGGKGLWHRVAIEFRLNRIVAGKSVPDGRLAYEVDGRVVFERNDVLFRTARHPDMRFNQLILGPIAESESPIEQTFWIDDLTVSALPETNLSPPTPP